MTKNICVHPLNTDNSLKNFPLLPRKLRVCVRARVRVCGMGWGGELKKDWQAIIGESSGPWPAD